MCCRFSPATMLRYYVFSRPFHRKPSAKNMWPPTQLYMLTQSTWDDLSSVKVLKIQFISLQTSIIQETIKWYIRLTKTKKKWPHGDLFIKQKCITLKTLKKLYTKYNTFILILVTHWLAQPANDFQWNDALEALIFATSMPHYSTQKLQPDTRCLHTGGIS